MKSLDKAIAMIPEDKLDWKPGNWDECKSFKSLVHHVYSTSLLYAVGPLKGIFRKEDFAIVFYDKEKVKSVDDLLDYAKKVQSKIHKALDEYTEEMMNAVVNYEAWSIKLGGFESLASIHEDVVHHRGQLVLYLRMIGIKPPFFTNLVNY